MEEWNDQKRLEDRVVPIHNELSIEKGELLYELMTLCDVQVKALIDTGAQTSIIERKVLNELQIQRNQNLLLKNQVSLRCADNRTVRGELAKINVGWKEYTCELVVVVLENMSFPVIIGMDILTKWPILCKPTATLQTMRKQLKEFKLGDLDETLRPPIDGCVLHKDHNNWIEHIQKELAENLETVNVHSTLGEVSIEFMDPIDRIKGVWRNQGTMPQKAQEFYSWQVEEWMKCKVVEEMIDSPQGEKSVGPFNIRGFYVWSGKDRIVHNFKPINEKIRDDTKEVPGIDHTFNFVAVSGTQIFSRIDLRSAYLQLPLRESDRSVCAFTCGNKRYRFITAPLGLKTIPSQFQRWMKALLQRWGCSGFAVNHMDDIIQGWTK